jgi:hypothetical protein
MTAAAPVTIERLDAGLDTLARLIDMGEAQYLPLFERLERELAALQTGNTAAERAARRAASLPGSPGAPGRKAARSASAV